MEIGELKKISQFLESEEGKSFIEKQAIYFKKMEDDKNKQIKDIISNTKYLKWLINFMQDKDGFTDDDWLYFPDKISDFDRENVEKLMFLYEGINQYAGNNYIYPILDDYGYYYKVRFNNFGFHIGIRCGQGTMFFCHKVLVDDVNDFIDFKDVMINKEQEYVPRFREDLNSLSDLILDIYKTGVPIEAIRDRFNTTMEKITYIEKKGQAKIKKLGE